MSNSVHASTVTSNLLQLYVDAPPTNWISFTLSSTFTVTSTGISNPRSDSFVPAVVNMTSTSFSAAYLGYTALGAPGVDVLSVSVVGPSISEFTNNAVNVTFISISVIFE